MHWVAYHVRNGAFDDGGRPFECNTLALAEREARKSIAAENAYHAEERRPNAYDGFEGDDMDGGRRSDAAGRL